MKKIITILTIIAMLICSINIGFAYSVSVDEIESDASGRIGSLTEFDVYVTDGYYPVPNATVTIDGKTEITNENGIAHISDIRTSFDPYSLTVYSDELGERHHDIIISSEEITKYTVSYWTPKSKSEYSTYSISAPTINKPSTNAWYTYILKDIMNHADQMVEYEGYIYFFDNEYNGDCYVLDTSDHSLAVISSLYGDDIALDKQNGIIYIYSSMTVDGPYIDEPERIVAYKFVSYDIETGYSSYIQGGPFRGRMYNDIVADNGRVYLIGGEYLGDTYEGLVNEIDYPYIDRYDVNEGWGIKIFKLYSKNASGLAADADDDTSAHIVVADDTGNVYSINTSNDDVKRITSFNYSEFSSLSIYNDMLYAADATSGNDNFYRYDLATGKKIKNTALPGTQKVYASKVFNGNIYTVWGNQNDDESFVGVYNIKNDSWSVCGIDHDLYDVNDDCFIITNNIIYAVTSENYTQYLQMFSIPKSGDLIYEYPQYPVIENITQIDSFRNQTLAVNKEKKVFAWGEGYYGNGSENMKIFLRPHEIEGISNAKQAVRGKNHNLVLDENGNVWGWGSNSNYPMSSSLYEKVTKPTQIPLLSDVAQIAAGAEFSLFLKNDGTLWGVGKNNMGQLGQDSLSENISEPIQIKFDDSPAIKYIDAGEEYAVAASDTAIYVWGTNSYGQMGKNPETPNLKFTPVKLAVPLDVGEVITKISAGTRFGLILTNLNNVYVWGDNKNGEYGRGDKINTFVPTKIDLLNDIIDVSAGVSCALAVDANGTVYGWGLGNGGNIGSSGSSVLKPTVIDSLQGLNISKVALGHDFSIFSSDSGYIYSIGNNANGSLGAYNLFK